MILKSFEILLTFRSLARCGTLTRKATNKNISFDSVFYAPFSLTNTPTRDSADLTVAAFNPLNFIIKIMNIKLKDYIEQSLFDTWGLTLNDIKGRDNPHSYIRGCISYYLIKKGVHITEIAELFGISYGTVYQYRDRVEQEKRQTKINASIFV